MSRTFVIQIVNASTDAGLVSEKEYNYVSLSFLSRNFKSKMLRAPNTTVGYRPWSVSVALTAKIPGEWWYLGREWVCSKGET